jgi:hypothetical protein
VMIIAYQGIALLYFGAFSTKRKTPI